MKIQDGANYVCADGSEAFIVGRTKDYPEYAYSRQGDWYEYATGRFVHYGSGRDGRPAGERYTFARDWRNIVSAAGAVRS